VRVEYVDLVDYLAIAAEVTGLDITVLSRVAKLNHADSALHAPSFIGFQLDSAKGIG
jgi:hypothetical protein